MWSHWPCLGVKIIVEIIEFAGALLAEGEVAKHCVDGRALEPHGGVASQTKGTCNIALGWLKRGECRQKQKYIYIYHTWSAWVRNHTCGSCG